ncbi:HupE/UreJ family protein [Vibrio sp. WXL103]|uniref:HupE/UreJ family protein n=1 Tax=Vibrio sp. WXL103 TaxID=3450710 RepID=UPI003EC8CB7C
MLRRFISICLVWICSFNVFAHSLDAMFVSIAEFAPNQYRAVVTPSAKADAGNTPRLVFPDYCTNESILENFYTLSCSQSLIGAEINVDYFLADLWVSMVVSFRDLSGHTSAIEVHQDNRFILSSDAPSQQSFSIKAGFEHMLAGVEHVLMVVLMVMLFPRWQALLKVISLFTLAHLTAMWAGEYLSHYISSQSAEYVIYLALVIGFYRLVISPDSHLIPPAYFAIVGLFHGLAMHGIIAELADSGQSALELVYFNLGVELAQLLVISGLLLLSTLARRLALPKHEMAKHLTFSKYAMSFLSLYFMVDFIAVHHFL